MPSKKAWVVGAIASFLAGAALQTSHGVTYASFSDTQQVRATAQADVWGGGGDGSAGEIPAECGNPADYAGVVLGTPGDDTMVGGNKRQLILGFGGNDTITGGNTGDCLVGGPGDDILIGGNGEDKLIGGPGDDRLEGGNGKDTLDGGAGTDRCAGENGSDAASGCETSG